MSDEKTIYYYEIALALPATWKQNVYTYCSENKLKLGQIVFVPFGSTEKVGYIIKKTTKQQYATKPISTETRLYLPDETRALIEWIELYYPGTPGVHVQHFIPATLKTNSKIKVDQKPIETPIQSPHNLTSDQQKAFAELTENSSRTNILHGVTGSGKTRLYCELVQKI